MSDTGLIDLLVPANVGAANIKLKIARPFDPRRAFHAIDLDVELLADALTSGLSLPLEMTVTAPSGKLTRNIFRRVVPSQISFTPQEGGQHLVRLREDAHNLWWGALVIEVAGEPAR